MKPTPSLLFKIATIVHSSSLDPYFFLLLITSYYILCYMSSFTFFFLLSYLLCVSSYPQENRRFGLFHSLSSLSELSPKHQEQNLSTVRLSAHGLYPSVISYSEGVTFRLLSPQKSHHDNTMNSSGHYLQIPELIIFCVYQSLPPVAEVSFFNVQQLISDH